MSQTQSTVQSNEKTSSQKNVNEESTSQYQIRPSIGKSFPIIAIREIINEVLLQILDGKKNKNNFQFFFEITIFLRLKTINRQGVCG